jgi:hypothetical protein
MVVLIVDCVYVVASYGASVAREVKHFVKVADCELCRGGFKREETVT